MRCVFHLEDVVAAKSTGNAGEYAVLRKCPGESAARLRVSEKHFVVDHAVFLAQHLDVRTTPSNVREHKYRDWSRFQLTTNSQMRLVSRS